MIESSSRAADQCPLDLVLAPTTACRFARPRPLRRPQRHAPRHATARNVRRQAKRARTGSAVDARRGDFTPDGRRSRPAGTKVARRIASRPGAGKVRVNARRVCDPDAACQGGAWHRPAVSTWTATRNRAALDLRSRNVPRAQRPTPGDHTRDPTPGDRTRAGSTADFPAR
jgi:hypothetical protein